MCDPMTIAAVGLSVAGTGASIIGQQRAAAARANVQEAEIRRQRAYFREGMRTVGDSTKAFGRPQQDNANAHNVQVRQQQYTAAPSASDPSSALPGVGDAPAIVGEAQGRSLATADTRSAAEAFQRAVLDAWGDTQLKTNSRLAANGGRIGMTAALSRGSAGVLPLELESAGQTGAGWRTAGTVLGALGQVAGGAGSAARSAGNPINWGDLWPWGGEGVNPRTGVGWSAGHW